MTSNNRTKLNKLLKLLPRGSILTTKWLKQHGISNRLAWWYVKAGWFEHISDGAYSLIGDRITWASAIAAVQQQLKLPGHVGGKTALQLLGKSHYLVTTHHEIQLFAPPGTRFPTWLQSDYWKEKFSIYTSNLFSSNSSLALIERDIDGLMIMLSTPERAALEICYLVPNEVTFTEAALILENLTRMRPKVVQELLETCCSIKAKRLFLYLAEHFSHAWIADINLNHVNLGKGKRVIAGGGHYNAKYKIAVPVLGENE